MKNDLIKVEVLSRDIIKPSSPTPQTLRNFKLSLLDQLVPPVYVSTLFFYSNNSSTTTTTKVSAVSPSLKNSLSKALTLFYPMAGQLNLKEQTASIDCNDEGAFFFEARVESKLADILSNPSPDFLSQLLPTYPKTIESSCLGALLLVQLTIFECGGLAIAVCISHKTCDVSTLCTFLKYWTSIARGSSGEVNSPVFIGDSLLPPREIPALPPLGVGNSKCLTRRFVFEGSKIASLKKKIKNQSSRVQAVSGLIFKCAISASRSISGKSTPAMFIQAVNYRNWMIPPLPENSVGNIVWQVPIFVGEGEEVELDGFAEKMREGMMEFCKEKAHKLKGDEGVVEIAGSLTQLGLHSMKTKDAYTCSSWCRTPLYETDFGWGKPVWVSSASQEMRNVVVLVDTKEGDGVEAWLTFEEQEMALFQQNEELLEFASLNPSVLV